MFLRSPLPSTGAAPNRTLNIEHRTSNVEWDPHSTFEVGRSTFLLLGSKWKNPSTRCNRRAHFRNTKGRGILSLRSRAMTETRRCPRCDQELPADAPAGLCPACLLQQGRDSHPSGAAEMTVLVSGFVAPDPADLQRHFPQLDIVE